VDTLGYRIALDYCGVFFVFKPFILTAIEFFCAPRIGLRQNSPLTGRSFYDPPPPSFIVLDAPSLQTFFLLSSLTVRFGDFLSFCSAEGGSRRPYRSPFPDVFVLAKKVIVYEGQFCTFDFPEQLLKARLVSSRHFRPKTSDSRNRKRFLIRTMESLPSQSVLFQTSLPWSRQAL